ncbi:MAG: C25 family cysteine peptidase [Bacteroidota bacterium]
MKKLLPLLLLLAISFGGYGQIWNGQDSLYGNEWINYDQDYYKIMVAEDGLFRLSTQVLNEAGIPTSSINASRFRLFHLGEEVPIHTSTNQPLSGSDYIEFYGRKNRSEMDRYLYTSAENEMLNPAYSLFTDTSAYFLTWDNGGNHRRVQQVSNDLSNLPAPEPFYWHEEVVVLSEEMIQESNSQGVSYSSFEILEGFAARLRRTNNTRIPTSAIYPAEPESRLSVRLATNTTQHQLEIRIDDETMLTDEFFGTRLRQYDLVVPTDKLGSNSKFTCYGASGGQDRNAPAVYVLTYPRNFDFSGRSAFHFSIGGANGRKLLEIANFDGGGTNPILYDITNHRRMLVDFDAGSDLTRAVLPVVGEDRDFILVNPNSGVKTVMELERMNFRDLSTSTAEYIILTNPQLYSDGNGNNHVQEYADYRASMAGGGYETTIVDIQQLYDQFGYGLHRHPLSVRNFANFLKKNWERPRYFFIIGKAREYAFTRTQADLEDPINRAFYVPTFGVPGADNLLISSGNTSSVPVLPLGRLAASSPDEIRIYLDKVKLLESNENLPQTFEDRAWQKRILHLSGGDPTIQESIANFLAGMENTIEDNGFGADVTTFYKTSTDPVQISESEEIFRLINDGVSIITFFGHSGVGTFDFNIDNPENYFNYGKYPTMFSLGCFSGNIHTSAQGISERFLFYEEKGAGSFIASTGQGFISVLRNFANTYYDLIGGSMYGQGLGDVLRATIQEYDSNQGLTVKTLHQQFTLHGDPALRMNPRPGPDFIVDASTVSFEPAVVSSRLDSFSINFAINNLGRKVTDSFFVQVEQELPGGDRVSLIRQWVAAPGFGDRYSFRVPCFGAIAAGLNRIYIEVDTEGTVEELPGPAAEMNNRLQSGGRDGVSLFIIDNSAQPVYPPDFGIVNQAQVTLKSSTRNSLMGQQRYLYQIDTTDTFNSPALRTTSTDQTGGVVAWQPDFAFEPGRTYYWRISPDSLSPDQGYVWEDQSFTYLPGTTNGWNQSHRDQFKENQVQGLAVNDGGDFDFLTNGFFITIRNKVSQPNDEPQYIYNFENPAGSVRPWKFLDAGIAVAVGDAVTGGAWENPPGGLYGSTNPNSFTRVFAFPTGSPEERKVLLDFLTDVVPTKNYVWLFSVQADAGADFRPEEWAADSLTYGQNLFQVLEGQGAQLVRNLSTTGAVPYNLVYRKDEGRIGEDVASTPEEIILTEVFIPINATEGSLETVRIGPAASWQSLQWDRSNVDVLTDTTYLSVIGIDADENQMVLIDRLQGLDTSLTFIDAERFPYLQLRYYNKDQVNRTAVDVDYFRVLYEGLPDVGLNPAETLIIYNDTLQQGEIFSFKTAVENLSDYPMDSLLVHYVISDQSNRTTVETQRVAPLPAGDTLHLNYQTNTRNLSGPIDFIVEVNPDRDQPELLRFNNLANYRFKIEEDERNPLLDVTFDGVHIMNGDIVSSRPEILISLKDDNPFLLLEDTSLVKVYLTNPAGQQRQIYFASDTARFYPPSNSKNRALVEVRPEFRGDGSYELLVQAQDITGNQSGELDYKVRFEIINKKSISNVLNYPNPFSTSTQFVYTLTGDEPPAHFKIQIFTVSGRIVKEITEQEIGPLKVGTHRTDYTWDGTDTYGQRLANGVYLYRVVAKNANGEDYERYDTSVDGFFRENFGKLVILR